MFDLTVSQAVSGTISGTVTLNAKQITAFRTGKFYIQVDSQKAPDGTIWGWLLPEHIKAGQDEPLLGNWFLPQGEGLKAPSGRQS